ncbi:uncharacterized protein LOC142584350 isoform X1 [Dermacentor variabilis]|uniref:uncharacterized protein LOC142584350 isoform X1 n=1 Tax=Dermacentor variabilis TaxID=34621 RepID=UPI003F5BF80E
MRVFLAICFLSSASLTGADEFVGGSFNDNGLRGHWSAGVENVGPHGAPGFSATFRASLDGSFSTFYETGPIHAGFDYAWNSNTGWYPDRRTRFYRRYAPYEPWGSYGDYRGYDYGGYAPVLPRNFNGWRGAVGVRGSAGF